MSMAAVNARNYSPATKKAIKEWFINSPNPITFSQMADQSEEYIGQRVSREDIVNMSSNDPEGNWQTLRSLRNPDTNDERISNIANELYKVVMGDVEEEDDGVKVKIPYSVRVQAARTFLEATARQGNGGSRAQTPASRVSELTTEVFEEARKRKAERNR